MLKEKMPKIEKASKTGFCLGVRRAINHLEKIARENIGVVKDEEIVVDIKD